MAESEEHIDLVLECIDYVYYDRRYHMLPGIHGLTTPSLGPCDNFRCRERIWYFNYDGRMELLQITSDFAMPRTHTSKIRVGSVHDVHAMETFMRHLKMPEAYIYIIASAFMERFAWREMRIRRISSTHEPRAVLSLAEH
eukprot:5158683-Pleurochrysis_carterae.AAC.1